MALSDKLDKTKVRAPHVAHVQARGRTTRTATSVRALSLYDDHDFDTDTS